MDLVLKKQLSLTNNYLPCVHVHVHIHVECSIYALLTKREVKMAGYWPSSFFAFLWTETKSRSIKTQKKNEANIQPS